MTHTARRRRSLGSVFSFLLLVASIAPSPARAADVMDQLVADGRFSSFVAAIRSAGLEEVFRYARPRTVLAPTNDAFARVPADVMDRVSKDAGLLRATVLGHLVPRALSAADLNAIARSGPWKAGLATASGARLSVSREPETGRLFVNRSLVVAADIAATNGLIHGIDSVAFARLPMTSATALNLSTLMGRWFEIARSPSRFEAGCTKTTLDLAPLPDGTISVTHSCTRDERVAVRLGKLRDRDPVNHSRLEASFSHHAWKPIWVVESGPDHALLASPSGESMWILSRATTLDEARVRDVLNRQIARGFAVGELRWVAH